MSRRLAAAAPWLGGVLIAVLQYRYLFADAVQCSRDLYGQYFSDTWFLLQRWREWSVPLWLPHERLGQPFMALLYTEALYPPRVIAALLGGEIRGPNWMHAFHAVFAFSGGFLAARRMNLGRAAAFVAAVPFALGPTFVVWAENLSFAASAAWAGWNVWAALRIKARPTPRRVAVLALTMTGAVFAGAPEMVVWQAVLVMALCGVRGLLATGVSGFAGAIVLLPAAELSREFTRAGAAPAGQLEWSASLAQLASIALPDADRPRVGGIWGTSDQWFWASLFIGVSVVLLSAASVLLRKRARLLFAFAAFFAVLSLGRNFGPAELLLRLPVLDGFRYPAKYLAATLFGVSMLAGIGVNRLQALARMRRVDGVHLNLGAAAVGLAIGLAVAARLLSGLREGFASASAWALCVSMLLAAIVVWRSARHLSGALAVVVALEMLLAPRQPLMLCSAEGLAAGSPIAERLRLEGVQRISAQVDRDDDEPAWCEPTPAETVIRTSKQRLSNLRFIEEDLRAVSGYGFRDPWRLTAAFAQGSTPFQLSGVSHLVLNTWESPRFEGATPARVPSERDVWLWRLPTPFPRSWFVGQARVATDEEALAALAGPAERFRAEVLVAPEAQVVLRHQGSSWANGVTAEPRPEVVVTRVDAPTDGYVVLADAWYPGWAVFIDGLEASPFRANFFLRGVAVARGTHQIEWRYQPTSVRLGALLSLLGLSVIAVALTLKRFGHVPA